MEATYKRRLSQSYMILQYDKVSEWNHETEILSYHQISGFLPIELEFFDQKVRFWYEITGRQSLEDYLSRRQADLKLLKRLFEAMEQVCSMVEDYLLEESGILLEKEYIYLDFEQRQVEFVYLLGLGASVQGSFRTLMEQLLQRLDHKDKQAVAVAYDVYQKSLQGEISLTEILNGRLASEQMGWEMMTQKQANAEGEKSWEADSVLTKDRHTPNTEQSEKAVREELYVVEENSVPKDSRQSKALRRLPNALSEVPGLLKKHLSKNQENASSFVVEPQDVMEESKATMHPTEILHLDEGARGVLMYQGVDGLLDLKIDKPSFLIGKNEQEVDGCIAVGCISRVHARIEKEQGEFYMEDLNSTNGTFLNGEPLEYHQKVQLQQRDRIAFGTVEYLFL